MTRHSMLRFVTYCLLMLVMTATVLPTQARAQAPGSDQCTSFMDRAKQSFDTANPNPAGGILSEVYGFIYKTVTGATEKIFVTFTKSDSYRSALYWSMVLMVVFYGVGFIMGIVQPSFQQVLIRLIKMGILFTLVSSTGWEFFHDNVVSFFQDGSDQLIKGVQEIATGIPAPAGATPFYTLDRLAEFMIHPDTIIAILGSVFSGGPYGLTMGGLMLIAMFGFFQLILKTLQIYAVTFVARALILGLAPIFFVFLLFERTKTMFMAWVNALVNLSLQPILLFTFLSFFIVLIESASRDMMGAELCWGEFKNVDGSVNKLAMWKYVDPTTKVMSTGDMSWQGSLECLLSPQGGAGKCAEFPVNIIDILSFLILIYLAQRFTEVVQRISSELSNAYVALDNQGKLEQMLQQQNEKGGGLGSFNKTQGGQPKGGKGRK